MLLWTDQGSRAKSYSICPDFKSLFLGPYISDNKISGICESLTFCAPNKVNTVGNIGNASQELRFSGKGVLFVTESFDAESQCFVTYSSQYVVL